LASLDLQAPPDLRSARHAVPVLARFSFGVVAGTWDQPATPAHRRATRDLRTRRDTKSFRSGTVRPATQGHDSLAQGSRTVPDVRELLLRCSLVGHLCRVRRESLRGRARRLSAAEGASSGSSGSRVPPGQIAHCRHCCSGPANNRLRSNLRHTWQSLLGLLVYPASARRSAYRGRFRFGRSGTGTRW
jgi:hypothetical protein